MTILEAQVFRPWPDSGTIGPMPADTPAATPRSIAEVERETGLPRATIRIWERRYGFPAPQRDERGERLYPHDQVEQLRHMSRLVEQGLRPAKLIAAGPAEIRRLAGERARATPAARPRGATQLLKLLHEHDPAAVKRELQDRLKRMGLARFAGIELATLNTQVGDAWMSGELQIHEEHLYSDCVYEVLRTAIAQAGRVVRPEAPRVVLTTFPQEPHGLGLLMAQALLALEGCATISLGVRLPVDQIVSAVRAYGADLVGLSFTGSLNPAHVLRGLEELRGQLPPAVRIWAGGNCPVLHKRSLAGVRAVTDVLAIPTLLAEDFALPPMAQNRP
jgi:MerR family transcriptional regulator, light-induced transcriptional regulator